jgi:UDP:flavonoid glycosyltransferase YjiC (YdhE family)
MRVMFTVSNWTTHWLSMVPTAWAFQAAGHEVRVVCTPDQEQAVSRAGLTPVPVLEGVEQAVKARTHNYRQARAGRWPFAELPPHPLTGAPLASLDDFDPAAWMRENWDGLLALAGRSSDAAVDFARWFRPELVVHDMVSLEGPLVGQVLGIPAVLHLWGPTGPDDPVPGTRPEEGASFVPPDLYGIFERHGVGPMGPHIFGHVIDPSPATLAPPLRGTRLAVRHLPYNGPGSSPSWLRTPPERTRVCAVWGTSVTRMFGPASFAVPRIVEALTGLDLDLVLAVTRADREKIGPVPPNVRVVEQVPLRLLLPESDLVIHHGGAGCVMTGLAAGVPQLSLPNALDQELVAQRIADAGGARAVHNSVASPDAIRSAALDLLNSDTARSAAIALRQEIESAPPPSALVASLVELSAGRRQRSAAPAGLSLGGRS